MTIALRADVIGVAKLSGPFLLMAITANSAAAQMENHIALGANLTIRASRNPAGHGSIDGGLLWRFGHSKTGWEWVYGLNWFSTEMNRTIGGVDVEFGKLHVRPLLGGYGYSWLFGRTAVSADVYGGYAFTHFKLTPVADDTYRDRLGARTVSAESANTFVVKPELGVWYDYSRRIGINAAVGYVVARPRITVSSSLGEDVQRYRADMLQFRIGAVYSIF